MLSGSLLKCLVPYWKSSLVSTGSLKAVGEVENITIIPGGATIITTTANDVSATKDDENDYEELISRTIEKCANDRSLDVSEDFVVVVVNSESPRIECETSTSDMENKRDLQNHADGKAPPIVLLEFPVVVRELLISSWLTLVDFVHLDTAISSKKLKEHLSRRQSIIRLTSMDNISLTGDVVEWMISRGVTMKQISIEWDVLMSFPCDHETQMFQQFCKHVHNLTFSKAWMDYSPEMQAILPHFRETLKSIDMPTTVEQKVLSSILSNFTALEYVFLGRSNTTETSIALNACPVVKGFGFRGEVADKFIFGNLSNFSQLTCLRVNDSKVTGVAILVLLKTHLIKFVELRVSGCEHVNDDFIAALAVDVESCAALTRLELSRTGITLSGIHTALNSFSNLTHFAVGGFQCGDNTQSVVGLVKETPFSLKFLDFNQPEENCFLREGTAITTDSMVINIVSNSPHLTHVSFVNCAHISSQAIRCLAHTCTQLVFIDLTCPLRRHYEVKTCCSGLGELMRTNCNLGTLKVGCRVIDLNPMMDMMTTYPSKLTTLDLSDCYLISDDDMITLIMHCHKLKRLNVSGCNKLTDAVLRLVQIHCKCLRALNIVRCHGISKSAIADMIINYKFQEPGLGLMY